MEGGKIIIFKANAELFGVPTSDISEIIQFKEVQKLAGAPDFVEGVIDMRGNALPVVDLNKRFGAGATKLSKKTKIIVAKVETGDVGFIVDEVLGITGIDGAQIEPPPAVVLKTGAEYITGIGKIPEGLVAIISMRDLLVKAEHESLTNIK